MMTKEEYKKAYIRMMDSKRLANIGAEDCSGVYCDNCVIGTICNKYDSNISYNVFEIIETVENWAKEHKTKTNADVFEEAFGCFPKIFRSMSDVREFFDKEYTNGDNDSWDID